MQNYKPIGLHRLHIEIFSLTDESSSNQKIV